MSTKNRKIMPGLQKKLNFTGSDEKFKEYVFMALKNRGPIYQEIFKMYYGLDCPKRDGQEVCNAFPGCNVPEICTLVLHRLEEELPDIIANDSKSV